MAAANDNRAIPRLMDGDLIAVQRCHREKRPAGKTKGHRVIAMPLCLTDLAPPAFTALCRNQISEPDRVQGKRRARLIAVKSVKSRAVRQLATANFVVGVTDPS